MIPNFPKNESVLSWSALSLTTLEQSWYQFISRVDDLVNTSMLGLEDKISMSFKNELFSSFLLRLNDRFNLEKDLFTKSCHDRFFFNAFSDIVLFSLSSFKSIIKNPSTELRRETKILPVAKANRFTAKTTMWLSKRPGASIKDKIAPKNEILTEVTIFSKDTKENREALYLYENLYWVLGSKLFHCDCVNCNNPLCGKNKEYFNSIKSLFSQRILIKNDIFLDVKKEKQLSANNKLISNPEYKCMWDSTKKFDNIDSSIKSKWFSIENKIVSIFKNALAGELLTIKGSVVDDSYGFVNDSPNKLSFGLNDNTLSNDIVVKIIGEEIKKITISQEALIIYVILETYSRDNKAYKKTKTETLKFDFKEILESVENDLISRCSFIDLIKDLNMLGNRDKYLLLSYTKDTNNETID